MKIPITKPLFDNSEKENILKPLESGWLVQGPFVAEFEKLFSEFIGIKFAKATTSCTTALHLALEALGIGKGDKVVVPSFTYVASANAVEYSGAEVVFCDIDLNTFNIDVNQLAQILKEDKKKKIKAVMPVNLFGLCANLPAICGLAKKYNLKVIEDSACGLGAYIGTKHSGIFGDCACFSFHPRKAITTGEGGMVVTSNEKITQKVSSLRDHGASKSDLERHKERGGSLLPEFHQRGYNYRMTDLQAAVGVAQIKKAAMIIQGRREIAQKYNQALKDQSQLITPLVPEGYIHGYQSYVCLFSGGRKRHKRTAGYPRCAYAGLL
jgi:dTDP-4-amino-4,6-dideoxygalactose transaminase